MTDTVMGVWPWYISGPLIGLVVPLLLLLGNRSFGVSSNLRHVCAALLPGRISFLKYDWKGSGLWNLSFAAGIVIGAFIAGYWLGGGGPVSISAETQSRLAELGIRDFAGLVPGEVFSWAGLGTLKGFTILVVGGFLVGFGSAYAGGCTSGHAITGLADLQLPSLIAVLRFFAGGLIATYWILPLLLLES